MAIATEVVGKGGGSQSWEHHVQVHRRQLESAEAAHQEPTTLSLTCRPAAGIGVIFLPPAVPFLPMDDGGG